MKQFRAFCLLALLAGSICMPAQSGAPAAKPAAPAPQAQQPAPTIAADVDREVSGLEGELVAAAEAMPEDKFNFAPASLNIPGSEFKGVRTFAEQVKHVAAANYLLWGAITGDKSPVPMKDDTGPDSLKTKTEIVKYLKDSYAVGHKAAKSLTVENIGNTAPSPFGGTARFSWLWMSTFAVAHGFDHYGQMVEYLRMNGIVPPASRRQQ